MKQKMSRKNKNEKKLENYLKDFKKFNLRTES